MTENRAILLEKGGDRAEVGNWRPITIDNRLIRLYAKVWDARLREVVKIDVRQKAFCPVDGCFDNVNYFTEQSIKWHQMLDCKIQYSNSMRGCNGFSTSIFYLPLLTSHRLY